jgi:hypothetical protein
MCVQALLPTRNVKVSRQLPEAGVSTVSLWSGWNLSLGSCLLCILCDILECMEIYLDQGTSQKSKWGELGCLVFIVNFSSFSFMLWQPDTLGEENPHRYHKLTVPFWLEFVLYHIESYFGRELEFVLYHIESYFGREL